MSYHTSFKGHFTIQPALTIKQLREYAAFSEKPHTPHLEHCPTEYCDWVVGDDGDKLKARGRSCFYKYDQWLIHVINHFFIPWGCTLNGEVEWDGEESGDMGKLILKDNMLRVKKAKIVYEE